MDEQLRKIIEEAWETGTLAEATWDKDYSLPTFLKKHEKQLMLYSVVGRSEQLRAFKQFLQSEYNLPISNRMVDEFEQKQNS